jgi:hypothetical protein
MPRRPRRCESGKVSYDTEGQALAYAKAFNLARFAHQERTMNQYLCTLCGFWHNSTDKSANRRTRKKRGQRRRQKAALHLILSVWEGEGGTVR